LNAFLCHEKLGKSIGTIGTDSQNWLFSNSLISADTSKSIGTVSALSALRVSALSALGVPIPVPIKIRVTFCSYDAYN
jgi:hypothetical protein